MLKVKNVLILISLLLIIINAPFSSALEFNLYNQEILNKGGHVTNNPYKYTDESGNVVNLATAVIGVGIGSVAGGLISFGTQLYQSKGDWSQVSWSDVGKSSVSGGVAGGVAGLTLGVGTAIGATTLGTGATAGLLSGEAFELTSSTLDNKPYTLNPNRAIVNTLIGVGSAGLGSKISKLTKPAQTSTQRVIDSKTQIDITGIGKGRYEYTKDSTIFRVDIGGRSHGGLAHHTETWTIWKDASGKEYYTKIGKTSPISKADIDAIRSGEAQKVVKGRR